MQTKELLEESQSHGLLAFPTQLPFYRVITRNVKVEEVFVMSRNSEDTILCMPFMMTHNGHMNCKQPILQVDGKELTCTNWYEKVLLTNTQVTKEGRDIISNSSQNS